jgi:hypothetical protein
LLAAFGRGDAGRPLLVDVNSPGLVSERVLDLARELVPDCELMARFEGGLTGAAAELPAGRLDVSFGRFAGLAPTLRARLERQPVGYEPMAVVLPEDHHLAALPHCRTAALPHCRTAALAALAALTAVPLDVLAGERVYAGAGNPRTLERTDLARQLFEGRGIEVAAPAPLAVGTEEFRRVMAKTRTPVLAVVDFPAMSGSLLRPLVDPVAPVPLLPVSLV